MACHILVFGVSLFEGMASSNRVKNLLKPLVENEKVEVSNLIRQNLFYGYGKGNNFISDHSLIKYSIYNPFSFIIYISKGCHFISKKHTKGALNYFYNYGYPDLTNIVFMLFAKLVGYKILLDIVEDNSVSKENVKFRSKIKNLSSLVLLKYSSLFTDFYLTLSTYLLEKVVTIAHNKKVVLIPVSVETNNWISKNNLSQNIKIFYGGSFGKKDAVIDLLNAFNKLKNTKEGENVELILTGKGDPWNIQNIDNEIDKLNLRQRVNFKGLLSTQEYIETVSNCDILCAVRNDIQFANAGFPFKICEFLASGNAVIATDIGDVGKYLQNEHSALLLTKDNKYLFEALQTLVKNKDLREKLGSNGKKVAQLNFDSVVNSKKLLKVLLN